MTLKYIRIPAPVVIGKQAKRDEKGEVVKEEKSEKVVLVEITYSLQECAQYIVDNDEKFAHPASHVREGARILKAFETGKPFIELKEEDWKSLNEAFEKPSAGWGSWINSVTDTDGNTRVESVKIAPRTFLDLINAVSEAVNTEPEPEQAAAPAAENAVDPAAA